MRGGLLGTIGTTVAAMALVMGLPDATSATAAASSWTIQQVTLPPGANAGELSGVSCPAANSCFADGQFFIRPASVETWNGSAWSVQTLPFPPGQNNATVTAISCTSVTACMAVGYFPSVDTLLGLAERWNGSTWTAEEVIPRGQTAGLPNSVSCASPADCFATTTYADKSHRSLIEHWNGSIWTAQAVPPPAGAFSDLSAVSCPTTSSCMATGTAISMTTGQLAPLAEQWNGSTWTLLDAQPPLGGQPGGLRAVSCTSAVNCLAVGGYGSGATNMPPLAERWNGSTWALTAVPLPSGGVNGVLNGISCASATACTAAGWWNKGNGNSALIDVWNGSIWAIRQTAAPVDHKTFDAISCTAVRTCTAVGVSNAGVSVQPVAEHE